MVAGWETEPAPVAPPVSTPAVPEKSQSIRPATRVAAASAGVADPTPPVHLEPKKPEKRGLFDRLKGIFR